MAWYFVFVNLFKEGGVGNGETPMGRKGQAEIPQEPCSEEAQRPPMESELFPATPNYDWQRKLLCTGG
ncbi:hypothetical protein EQV77_15890 [Halobacillus fulvus]|nr:hypothetical protein EQV77_15890 [Halobacillus fulvus]